MTANEIRDISNLRQYRFQMKTQRQQEYYDILTSESSRIVIGHGEPGTGKSIVAIKAAIDLLKSGAVSEIEFFTEACEVGQKLGHLPGTPEDKTISYFQSIKENMVEITGDPTQVNEWVEQGIVKFSPIAFIRGSTFKNRVVILDEAQNTSKVGMKTLLTRLGEGSKIFITGDEDQVDVPSLTNGRNGLSDILQRLPGTSKEISFVKFDIDDVVRDPLIKTILNAYKQS